MPTSTKSLTCPHCKIKFVPESVKQIYCSRMCSRAYGMSKKCEIINKVCDTCKTSYTITKEAFRVSKNKTTCYKCTRKIIDKERDYVKQCLECGKTFRGKSSTAKLCSTDCLTKTKNKTLVKFDREVPNTVKTRPVLTSKMPCADCSFGKASTHAETGWECLANARVCAPFSQQRLFKAKAES